ncbi:MAG: elongation factor G [Thermoanaerobaculia bacterium]|nr:elongation factor G [Thermoanaerobaculia bacterium]
MPVESPAKLRVIALVGHNDTGKTSTASALLYAGGASTRLARVEDKNTVCDFDPEEQERGISIGLAACHLDWRGHAIHLLDCPGYGIFFTETKAGMRVADASLVCVNGVAGVEVNTEKAWEFAGEIEQPIAFALTKMDRERADFERAVASVSSAFGRQALPVQLPIGAEKEFRGVVDLVSRKAFAFEPGGNGKGREVPVPDSLAEAVESWRTRLVEAVAESDESLMEHFFEEGTLGDDELLRGLRAAVRDRKLFPIVVGAPGQNVGTSSLLDFLIDVMPSPADIARSAQRIDGSAVALGAQPDGPLVAVVFKTLNDPFTGRLTLLRVLSGTLDNDAQLWNVRAEEGERAHGIALVQGKQTTATPRLTAGEIGAVPKLKVSQTGDTLSAKDLPLRAPWISIPEPAMSFALEPKSKGDEEKIGEALGRLIEEDPSLRAGRDPQTHEFLLSGTGQLHVEITVARLKRRSNVEVILHPPKVPYRETILKAADGHGRHKKQSGGRGQFADCKIRIEPLPRGADFEFVDEIFGGAIPQNYRPAVEKGIQEARGKGFLAGYPMLDFRVRLLDGQYHDVDSSELAFKIAGSLAYKDAMAKAAPTILEPIMKVEVQTSEEFMGDIMSDLSHRRGRPQGMDAKNGQQLIHALVPLAEMLNYAPALRSMTQGRSSFHMEYSHYEEVPRLVADKLVAEARRHHKEENEG